MPRTYGSQMSHLDNGNRPWSLGSQLLGHYDLDHTNTSDNGRTHNNDGARHPAIPFVTDPSNLLSSGGPSGQAADEPSTTSTFGTDKDQRPLLRASTTFYDRIITDWWWWELFSCLVSICCCAAIVGVLLYYDGKPQPQYLVPGVTLNAYISVFAAVAKAALILPVSEAIGQLKWLWFKEEANLYDFYTFDGASRGPWGALMLLGRTKCRNLVSLGAAITILALAFEPFFQQIVSFPARDLKSDVATISIATEFDPEDYQYQTQTNKLIWSGPGRALSVSLAEAVLSREESTPTPPYVCPSGRCSWPSYSSLAVCHQCGDLSGLLEFDCRNTSRLTADGNNVTQFCGYGVNHTQFVGTTLYRNKTATGLSTVVVHDSITRYKAPYWNSTLFPAASNAIMDFYVAYIPGNESEIRRYATPKLLECLFVWCVKSFEASYSNGNLHERVTHRYSEQSTTPGYQPGNGSAPGPFLFALDGKHYEIRENTTNVVAQALREALPMELYAGDMDSTGQYPGIWSTVQHAPFDIEPAFAKMADTITNNVRSRPKGTVKIEGVAWSTQNFVEARWVWVTLPVCLMLSTLTLIWSTIAISHSKAVPTWKSSALATLLHGVTETARHHFDAANSMSDIEALSQRLRVKLSLQEASGRIVPV